VATKGVINLISADGLLRRREHNNSASVRQEFKGTECLGNITYITKKRHLATVQERIKQNSFPIIFKELFCTGNYLLEINVHKYPFVELATYIYFSQGDHPLDKKVNK
jgi:hypothetical protein